MGSIVNGEGTVTVKEPNMVNVVEKLISSQVMSRNMNLTCEITNDTALYLHEETAYWSESDLLNVLNAVLPYMKEGEMTYVDEDHNHWQYQYDPEKKNWYILKGTVVYRKPNEVKKGKTVDASETNITIEDLLYLVGGNTNVQIFDKERCLWNGTVDDYDFETAPYGYLKPYHVTVMKSEDVLKVYFDHPSFSIEDMKNIDEIKKYFYFCEFPDNGPEMLYIKYGYKTEKYIRNHSLNELILEIK